MFEGLKNKIRLPSVLHGISVDITGRGQYRCAFVTLKKVRGNIDIVQSGVNYNSLEILLRELDKNVPVALSIGGNGLVHKKLQKGGLEIDEALPYILPNAAPDDFAFQKTTANSGQGYYSVMRKSALNEWVEIIEGKGFSVIDVVIGPFAAVSLFPLLDITTSELHFGSQTLELVGKGVANISPNGQSPDSDIRLGETKVNGNVALPFMSAFQLMADLPDAVHIESPELHEAKSEFYHKKVYRWLLQGGLCVIFCVLLANYFVFDTLKATNAQLQEKYQSDSLLLSSNATLKSDMMDKKNFLGKAGWLNDSKASYFCDRIAYTLGDDISLTYLGYQPEDKAKSKKERRCVYANNQIFIKGICNSGLSLNPWMKKLEQENWVKDVQIKAYEYDSKKKLTAFTLALVL